MNFLRTFWAWLILPALLLSGASFAVGWFAHEQAYDPDEIANRYIMTNAADLWRQCVELQQGLEQTCKTEKFACQAQHELSLRQVKAWRQSYEAVLERCP